MKEPPVQVELPDNPWLELRRLTPARIALGRTGTSIPTSAQLDFQFAHAQARDAVHLPFDHEGLSSQMAERGRESLLLHSAAVDRHMYLQRPDLGRRLSNESAQSLRDYAAANPGGVDLAVVVADGLSALAVHKHTLPFLTRMEEQTHAEGWSLSPVILVEQGRVAVADEIGQLLGAKMVVILIGERPGRQLAGQPGVVFHLQPQGRAHRCVSQLHFQRAPGRPELRHGRASPALLDERGVSPAAVGGQPQGRGTGTDHRVGRS